ncbi:MAG: radical SAM protein [Candidatus Gorgyraea atricola]|nr:radical SAM protein [Candidatus Gorgyraea atricola]
MEKTILKPGRYINKEWNAVHKEWTSDRLKVALCFPDIYEIGMSHLGMKIIYGLLNSKKDILCERVFSPWVDMERKMRTEGTVLTSLESRRPLKDFDILGFSLQYEMSFVDVLNILELGEIPLRSADRGDEHPLVIAGGPCAFNPEPMADFVDAFVIGEAEEAVLEITGIIRDKGHPSTSLGTGGTRDKVLRELAKIKGVYVPTYRASNITKRIIGDLDSAYFPTDPIVPYLQIVHDRISIEIMRGCPHRCRFCQACKIFQPLRIRSVKRILEIAEESIKSTGYEEISLLSLSSGNYPYLEELVGKLGEKFKPLGIKISLPSLRVKSFDAGKAGGVVKRAGLTFAPESGSDRLRKLLNKDIENKDIIQRSEIALKSGWKKVKLYFMIGLPGEREEDLDAIIELASSIKRVNLSISPFIPKPHSEFEREGMEDIEVLKNKREYLRSKTKIRMDFHDLRMSRIEAILSRGDRKVGQVIQMAWQKGARLQAWTEHFNYDLWLQCFEESGINPDPYLTKNRDTKFPWSFIVA